MWSEGGLLEEAPKIINLTLITVNDVKSGLPVLQRKKFRGRCQ